MSIRLVPPILWSVVVLAPLVAQSDATGNPRSPDGKPRPVPEEPSTSVAALQAELKKVEAHNRTLERLLRAIIPHVRQDRLAGVNQDIVAIFRDLMREYELRREVWERRKKLLLETHRAEIVALQEKLRAAERAPMERHESMSEQERVMWELVATKYPGLFPPAGTGAPGADGTATRAVGEPDQRPAPQAGDGAARLGPTRPSCDPDREKVPARRSTAGSRSTTASSSRRWRRTRSIARGSSGRSRSSSSSRRAGRS